MYTMPFGKYKGCLFDDVPLDYLLWLRENIELRSPPKERVYRRLQDECNQGETQPLTKIPDLRSLRRRFSAKYHPDRATGCRLAMKAVNELIDELEGMLL